MKKYIIISENKLYEVANEVNEKLEEGYILSGNLIVETKSRDITTYSQAMIKSEIIIEKDRSKVKWICDECRNSSPCILELAGEDGEPKKCPFNCNCNRFEWRIYER